LLLGFQAWNAAIIRNHDEELFQVTRGLLEVTLPGDIEIVELFDLFVVRKMEVFFNFNRVIVEFEVNVKQGLDFDLSIATESKIEA
jgi:hypothetical protein